MDIAVDLTSALATRMKPPPKPPRDLKPSTAVWILSTGLALALLIATLVSSNNFIEAVLTIGAAQVLAGWKDEFVAGRIAELIGRAGTETSAAQDALVTLGGPFAERAAIPLLRKDDQGIRLTAIEILGHEKVGGADAVAALKEVARTSPDPGTRQPAEAKARLIEERLHK